MHNSEGLYYKDYEYGRNSEQYGKPYNFMDSMDTQVEYDYHNSQLDNRTYRTDIKPAYYRAPEFELIPKVPIDDPNDPANMPYMPIERYEDSLQEYVMRFVRNLPRHTPNHEEVAFAKYLAECCVIDKKISHLQQLLRNDPRFSANLLFDYFDCKRSHYVDYNEFQMGLQKLDIIINSVECYQLFKRYGGDDDDRISSAEFKHMLIGPDDSGQFMQFGALKYMHHPLKLPTEQFLSVAQRDTMYEVMTLQLSLERNLNFIREVIGDKDTLMALFRQIDIGAKGYIVMSDLVIYLNELGGEFDDRDLGGCFRRLSKMNCSRVNFNEFRMELLLDTYKQHQSQHEQDVSGERRRLRQRDYIQELRVSQQPVKVLDKTSLPQVGKKAQLIPPKMPYVQQPPPQAPQEKQPQFGDEDMNDVLFPGFERYVLKESNI